MATFRNGSGTTDAGSKELAPARKDRRYFYFQNHSDTDMWINVLGLTASAAQPSILVKAAGGFIEAMPTCASETAFTVFCASAAKGFTYLEC